MPRNRKKGRDRASTKARAGPQPEAPPSGGGGGGQGHPGIVDTNGGGPVGGEGSPHGALGGGPDGGDGGQLGAVGHGAVLPGALGGEGPPQGALGGGPDGGDGGQLGAVGHGAVLPGALGGEGPPQGALGGGPDGGDGGQLGAVGHGAVLPGALGGGGDHLEGDAHGLGHGAVDQPPGVFVGGPGWGVVNEFGVRLPPIFVPDRVAVLVPPDVPEEQPPVPETKKTGKKASRRKALQDEKDAWYEPQPPNGPQPADENSEFLAALKLCIEFEKNVYATKVGNMLLVRDRFQNLPVLFMESDLSPPHMSAFYRSSEHMYSVLYPLKVNFELPDGTKISLPVAPDMEPINERSHHIVAMPRSADKAVALFIVENFSGYLVGGKVVKDQELWSSVMWGVFGGQPLPSSFGKEGEGWVKTLYGLRYSSNVNNVVLEDDTGDKIINFFDFRKVCKGKKGKKDKTGYELGVTSYGELIIDTVIVIVCEGRRFWFIEEWVLGRRGKVGLTFYTVTTDWLSLCKCIFYLILYQLEDEMSQANNGGEISKLAKKSQYKALKWWNTRQEALKDTHFPTFFVKAQKEVEQVMPTVGDLGRLMKLLKNDEVLSAQIHMRENGYRGCWIGQIGEPIDEGADDTEDDQGLYQQVQLDDEDPVQDDELGSVSDLELHLDDPDDEDLAFEEELDSVSW